MPSKIQLTGGAFQDSEGNVLANGYLKLRLSQDASVSGVGNICSGVEVTIQLDASGNAVASPAQSVWGNDNLLPINTYYRVTGYTAAGQPAWGPNNQQVEGSGTFDLGTWVPNSVISWQPVVNQPLVLKNSGVLNSSQSLLNLESTDGSITITDEGSGNINLESASGSATAGFMLGPGLLTLASAGQTVLTGWSDTELQVNVLKFVLTATLTGATHLDGSFGCNLGGGGSIVVGIYSSIGNCIWSSGVLSVPNVSNTAISFTVPSLTLSPGTYYLAWAGADAGNTTMWGWSSAVQAMSYHSGTGNANVVNQTNVLFGTAANPATSGPILPATLGSLTAYSSLNSFGIPAVLFS